MNNDRIAIIGLGYVGLPLAVAFAKQYSVIGFDINRFFSLNEKDITIFHKHNAVPRDLV